MPSLLPASSPHLQVKGVEPYAVHLTWTYHGTAGKRSRLRDMGLWHDSPEYYAGPSYVTVALDLPDVRRSPCGRRSPCCCRARSLLSLVAPLQLTHPLHSCCPRQTAAPTCLQRVERERRHGNLLPGHRASAGKPPWVALLQDAEEHDKIWVFQAARGGCCMTLDQLFRRGSL